MITFPVIDAADQKFSTIFNGRRVSIRLRFNHVSNRWSFDIAIDGNPVLHGRRIVTGVDLLYPFGFGIGVIFAHSETNKEPNREFLANGLIKIYHTTEQEVDAALAS